MENVVLVIHLFLALAIIGLVLLQRSEGGGLGIGGGGGLGSFASARSTANALSKMTWICAVAFFCTSLLLGILAGGHSKERQGILGSLEAAPAAAEGAQIENMTVEEDGETGEETKPSEPSAPIAE